MIGFVRARLARARAIVALALAQLAHDRARTLLAVFGVALAVLATTLLAGTGVGVIETGQQKFDAAGRDIWVTGGPVQFAPGTVGGIQNSIHGAHELSRDIESREDVANAVPLAFQTVYVANDSDGPYRTLVGVGGPARGGSVSIQNGSSFSSRDVHYADGAYDGPMTHEVVIDQRTAALFDVGVGDTLYIGGTLASARENGFRVVGISNTFSSFLGTPSVTVHLSELQEVTGTTGTDSATLITVTLEGSANSQQVAADLQRAYPAYDVRTNREQLQATLRRQAVVLAAGASLVVMAVLAGLALTVNLLLSMIHQQREAFAALKAVGASTGTLTGVLAVQALLIGILGGLLGVSLTIPAVEGLNFVAHSVTGFEDVVRTQPRIMAGGFTVALLTGLFAAVAAGWRLAGLSPLETMR